MADPIQKKADPFLSRLCIKQKGKKVETPERDNYTVQAVEGTEITKAERPVIIAELRNRFKDCRFTWIG